MNYYPMTAAARLKFLRDCRAERIAEIGVTSTFAHKENPNVIIRTGRSLKGYHLFVTVSMAKTFADKVNDLEARLVIDKKFTTQKGIENWLKKIDLMNSVDVIPLLNVCKKSQVHLEACKRLGSRLYRRSKYNWGLNGKGTIFTLIGPLRADGTMRLHSYAGNIVKGKLVHRRTPSSMPVAFTDKEALYMVAEQLKRAKK